MCQMVSRHGFKHLTIRQRSQGFFHSAHGLRCALQYFLRLFHCPLDHYQVLLPSPRKHGQQFFLCQRFSTLCHKATSVFASACRHVNLAKTVSGSPQRESSRPQNQEPILESFLAFEKLRGRWRGLDADMHL